VVLDVRDAGVPARRGALKLLLNPRPTAHAKRFLQEARVLAAIRHPNLVRLLDFGESPLGPYLVMERIDGEDLGALVRRVGPLPSGRAVAIVAGVADCLEALHAQGLVHRDVKPGNVLLERATGRPVVLDLGVVKRDPERLAISALDATRLSVTGEVLGTPAYMAPEQLDPTIGAISARTDVYALGALLYFLLAGRAPYRGAVGELLLTVLRAPPPDPALARPDVPSGLAALCRRAMAKAPSARPPSAAAFAAAARAARPAGRSTWRPAAALLLLGLVAGGGGGLAAHLTLPAAPAAPAAPGPAGPPPADLASPSGPGASTAPPEPAVPAWRARAELAFARGALEDVLAALDAGLAEAPPDPSLATDHALRARAHLELRSLDDALAASARAQELDPDLVEAALVRAETLDRARRADEAEAALLEAATRTPDDGRLHAALGRLSHRPLEARRASLVRARELGAPDDVALAHVLLQLGELEAARATADAALDRSPSFAWALYARGAAAGELGDHAAAVVDLSRSLALRPESPWTAIAYYRLAVSWAAFGERDAARAHLRRAAAELEVERFKVGRSELEAGLPAILARIERAGAGTAPTARWPEDDPEALVARAVLRALEQRRDAALGDLERALAVRSELRAARLLRGRLVIEDDPETTASDCARLLAADPSDVEALLLRAFLRGRTGDLAAGLADLDRCVVLRPESFRAHLELGRAAAQLDRPERALRALSRAARLDRMDPLPFVLRARVFRSRGRAEAARRDYRYADALLPGPSRFRDEIDAALGRR